MQGLLRDAQRAAQEANADAASARAEAAEAVRARARAEVDLERVKGDRDFYRERWANTVPWASPASSERPVDKDKGH